jgi:ParB family chromosome partitioning protein
MLVFYLPHPRWRPQAARRRHLKKKKVLGRGLGALIDGAGVEKTSFRTCPVGEIRPSRRQPRKGFEAGALAELSDSIKEKGIIEPLIVRGNSPGFELIAGERRWRAAKLAGLAEVPVIVVDATDEESLELAIIENIQREDLNAVEEAEAFRTLMGFGLSQEQVAKKVGKDRATVANYLRLLKLPADVRAELEKGNLSMGHARAILSLTGHAGQRELARRVIKRGLSVRETEKLAARGALPSTRRKGGAGSRHIKPLEEELRRAFGTKVSVKDKGGRGSIEIEFYSAEERERIIELLRSAT